MSTDDEIRKASQQFYAGLNRMGNGQADALSGSLRHRVTNIYRREAGAWKLVHHHTDISPAMLDVLARLPPASA